MMNIVCGTLGFCKYSPLTGRGLSGHIQVRYAQQVSNAQYDTHYYDLPPGTDRAHAYGYIMYGVCGTSPPGADRTTIHHRGQTAPRGDNWD
jgi:hypothetical protein